MPFSLSGDGRTDPALELEQLDCEVIELLRRRAEMTRALLDQDAMPLAPPTAEYRSNTIELYRAEFGGPGELLARAVLNLCGVKQRPPDKAGTCR
ncbi:hypothetical protein AB0E04_45495 [Streptomyces sp. NPDC048251]|uniref:hypothetical protein n=1 Tax=Streptomyces sp. NPDC048251 TaxID=3154501 RepID=UPI003419591F